MGIKPATFRPAAHCLEKQNQVKNVCSRTHFMWYSIHEIRLNLPIIHTKSVNTISSRYYCCISNKTLSNLMEKQTCESHRDYMHMV